MSDYHCLDIEFINVDFSSYYIKGKTEVSKVLLPGRCPTELSIHFPSF